MALKEDEPQRRKTKREEDTAAFNIVVVRVNLAWVGCANSCESCELQQEWKEKYSSFPHLVCIKTLTIPPANRGSTTFCLSSLLVFLLCEVIKY
jgi:hypothetical protein